MEMGKTGNLLVAILSGLCLAAALGCGGKTHYNLPYVLSFSPTQAKTGTNVTIGGANFTGVLSVSFGGEPAQAYLVNGTSGIVATVPDNAVSGDIVVENPAGLGRSSYFSTVPFIVTPVITDVEPKSGPAGTVVTVTGSGFGGVTSVAFGTEVPGQPGSSTFTYIDPNTVTVVVGANATPGNVVLTASGVASDPWTGFSLGSQPPSN